MGHHFLVYNVFATKLVDALDKHVWSSMTRMWQTFVGAKSEATFEQMKEHLAKLEKACADRL